jgi:hypothetical protein
MRTHHPPPHGFDKFIARARDLHGVRFQCDRSSWVDADNHVRIQCPAHGWFTQISRNHIRPNSFGGCTTCRENDSWMLFLSKTRKKHGVRFEYDRSSWKNSGQSVSIKCQMHGWFKQKIFDHLRHSGCFECAKKSMNTLLPLEELMASFRKAHGDRYSYDKVDYKGTKETITIVCQVHGDFRQKPAQHMMGNGCQRCSKRYRWNTEEFINNSREVHGNKFTYDRTEYLGALASVTITCPHHGDFQTQPARHIQFKNGCPHCNSRRLKSPERFIQDATARFGDRYDYSLVKYVNSSTPIKIICKRHGIFEQPPSWHLNNAIGCQQCSYNVSSKETAWLDSLNLPSTVKRQTKVLIDGRRRNVDAVDNSTRTIYEFWGDWWHGNPKFFASDDVHPKAKKTYGELYRETLAKRRAIKRAGFKLVEIWEHKYDSFVKSGKMLAPGVAEYATVE